MRHGWPAVSHRRYVRPGTLMVSQGHTGYFTAFLLRSGHYVHVSLPIMACICKVFFCSLPFPPSPINYVLSTLGSTDMLACKNSRFSSLFKLHCFRYCVRMTDKRQKATKVKFKRDETVTNKSISVEYILL